MRFLFRLATAEDDVQLRRLMAVTSVPGSVTLAFEREPDFFAACPTMGECRVMLAIEAGSQRLAAALCLSRQLRWWEDESQLVGYVGGLRVHPDFKGTNILTRALPSIHKIATDWGRIPWFTVIPGGNRASEGLFVRNIRAAFPVLKPLSSLITLGLLTSRRSKTSTPSGLSGITLIPGRTNVHLFQAHPEEVSDFLAAQKDELRPCWSAEDISQGSGLGPLRLLGATRDGKLVGTAAVWDQEGFKQSVVKSYSPSLARFRPLYNLAASLMGFAALPDPGQPIRSAYLSCFCVPKASGQEGRQVARLLLRECIRQTGILGMDYLMAGFSAPDPVLPLARKYPHVSYQSGLYSFSFTGQDTPVRKNNGSNPCVEIGTL